jgi:hypothetical protein
MDSGAYSFSGLRRINFSNNNINELNAFYINNTLLFNSNTNIYYLNLSNNTLE